MHMFDARDERRISGNIFDSMHAFIYDVALLYEGKNEDIVFSLLTEIQHFDEKAFQNLF